MKNATQKFLIDYAAGKHPAVPDSVWHGDDCWVIYFCGGGWKISKRGRDAMETLRARADAHQN